MGEIFMQNRGTLVPLEPIQARRVPTRATHFLLFPHTSSCISPIKISCHFNSFRQSYAEWDYRLPNSGCHQVVKHLEKLPMEEQLRFGLSCRGGGQHCASHTPRAPGDTLHSSERQREGMEHTQSHSCLL